MAGLTTVSALREAFPAHVSDEEFDRYGKDTVLEPWTGRTINTEVKLIKAFDYYRQFDRSIWALSATWLVTELGFAASVPFLSIYFHSRFGLPVSKVGMLFASMIFIRAVAQIAGGELCDRVNRRTLLIIAQLCRTATFSLMAWAIYGSWGMPWLVLLILANFIGGAVIMPAGNTLVSDIMPPKKRLDGFAIARAARNLGWASGPALGGFMAEYSYSWLFLISAGLSLIGSVCVWLFLPEPERRDRPERFRFGFLLELKEDALMTRHIFLTILLYLVVGQLVVSFSVYAVDMIGLPSRHFGLLYTVNGLLVVLLQVPLTRWVSPLSLTTQLYIGALAYWLGYGTLGIYPGFGHFIAAIIVITFGEILISPPALALTSRLAPAGKIGRYMGIYGFAEGMGWALAPLFGGMILDVFGTRYSISWAVIAALALLAALGYQRMGRRPALVEGPDEIKVPEGS